MGTISRYPDASEPAITLAEVASVLGRHGYRITRPREAVVNALLAYGRPFTAEQVVADLKETDPGLGRATVYRTLEILASVDVLTRLLQPGGNSAYVVGLPGHRHHLICSRCGTTISFTRCPMEELVSELTRNTNFAIEGHLIEVFGVCPTCQEQSPRPGSLAVETLSHS